VIVASNIAARDVVKNPVASSAGKPTAVTNRLPMDAPIIATANESTANA